ncbi:MAG: L,D-transpeptidase family protein, partial [Candidatus Colwellbacteria bacterium]|nr:L,D-transpeptidase family protein [Candidatus Colwellbacteria bacterium]
MNKHWILLPLLLLLAGGLFFSLGREKVYSIDLANAPILEAEGVPAANPNFYKEAKEKLIKEEADFIEADLSSMKLTIYTKGVPEETFPILTKGKEGSWWETPAGIYQVGSKASNHFSSFGQVYQPWSVQFQGNFFIHGWPYYPGGQPVASTYSGGCIRLATADAKKVFEKSKTGMPVLVFEETFSEGDGFVYKNKNQLKTGAPNVSAKSFLIVDLKNNEVLLQKNGNEVLPIASITKLMTALVATDHMNIEKTIAVNSKAIIPTSLPRLQAGEEASIYDLLFPLLLESSNEAAEAIAYAPGRERFVKLYAPGRERFVKLMNEKTKAIGMNQTNFADPAGRADENTGSAEDLLSLAKYLYSNRSFILKMTTNHLDKSIYGEPAYSNLKNLNIFG